MSSDELMSCVVDFINQRSLRFSASIPDELHDYHGNASNLSLCHKERVMLIRRRRSYKGCVRLLPLRTTVFASQLMEYAQHLAVTDNGFKARLQSGQLSADDIEVMVCKVTYGRVNLHLRGRRIFEEDKEDY